jgi:hypothetical protein
MDGYFLPDFYRNLEKRPRLNPRYTDAHLHPDGSVTREEDKVIACQRIWRERAYAPPGTLFAARGRMYRKIHQSFTCFVAEEFQGPPRDKIGLCVLECPPRP